MHTRRGPDWRAVAAPARRTVEHRDFAARLGIFRIVLCGPVATLDVVVPESPRELPFDLEEADTNNALAELDLSYDAHGDFALASDDLRYLMEDCAATARETTRLVAWLKQLTQAPRSLARSLKALRSSEDALRRITLAPRGLKI